MLERSTSLKRRITFAARRNQASERQARFIEQYLIDGNGKKAATRAGYSKKTAESQASRLLRNAKVKAEIQHRRDKMAAKAEVSAERVIDEIACVAFFDPADIVRVVDVRCAADIGKLPARVRRAIGGWKWTKEGFEIKLADKGRALDQLARHLALYNDKVTVDLDFTERLAARIAEAQAKVGK
jgi:phage terminase small subunit